MCGTKQFVTLFSLLNPLSVNQTGRTEVVDCDFVFFGEIVLPRGT